MKQAYFNWSTGKDSALALYKILQNREYAIGSLVTTVNQKFNRVSMHGVSENLLDLQAKELGLPLYKIYFPEEVSMESYNTIMKAELAKIVNSKNYKYSVFGDIFLEDLKVFRETKLAELNINGVFPLWKLDTNTIIKEFISLGFKAITVAVNANLLDKSFVGRIVDESFINDLPQNVDVCGENGEFHTFVFDGPIFKNPIPFKIGEKVLKTYPSDKSATWDSKFWYCNLISK
ncbi:diphthine--ammonia ligase [Lutibacter sp. A64]|uniref:Dph6-related ATP pyrophosphatase n=1 Tax=Lutibacter sp. A64 TaxID=2918526 RepID=UPI001F06BE62|nr:diphthine--ammonia ligase [Lutibacter sp. A64]UMB54330.1 diphthine--ammonia ligase [Lutibacter sp. A64]